MAVFNQQIDLKTFERIDENDAKKLFKQEWQHPQKLAVEGVVRVIIFEIRRLNIVMKAC